MIWKARGSAPRDWVTGTPFSIIDNGNIFDDYQNTYYPTILTVCPNRLVTEAGQVDVATHVNIFQDALCMPAMLDNDALLIDYVGQRPRVATTLRRFRFE